jgi:hypothetical protein
VAWVTEREETTAESHAARVEYYSLFGAESVLAGAGYQGTSSVNAAERILLVYAGGGGSGSEKRSLLVMDAGNHSCLRTVPMSSPLVFWGHLDATSAAVVTHQVAFPRPRHSCTHVDICSLLGSALTLTLTLTWPGSSSFLLSFSFAQGIYEWQYRRDGARPELLCHRSDVLCLPALSQWATLRVLAVERSSCGGWLLALSQHRQARGVEVGCISDVFSAYVFLYFVPCLSLLFLLLLLLLFFPLFHSADSVGCHARPQTQTHTRTYTEGCTQTHTHIYIYIYIII